jgi:rhamnosyltransferase
LQAIDAHCLKRHVALVLHVYHVDLLDTIFSYVKNIICPADFFISVKNVEDYFAVKDFFKRKGIDAHVYVHENRGRDVGPFVSLLNSGLLDRYTCVCKIHSKKSTYHADGGRWRDELYGGLLGSKYGVLRIISAFEQHQNCGMIGADNAYVTNSQFWGGNEVRLRALASELGISAEKIRLGFFAGTMFWFRPAALADLKARHLQVGDFDPEEGQRDATLAHVLERLFPLIVENRNYFVATSARPSVPLEYDAYENRGVLVL